MNTVLLVNHPDKPGEKVDVTKLVDEYIKTRYGNRVVFHSAEGYEAARVIIARNHLASRLSEEDCRVLNAYTHYETADLRALLFEDADATHEAHLALYGKPMANC